MTLVAAHRRNSCGLTRSGVGRLGQIVLATFLWWGIAPAVVGLADDARESLAPSGLPPSADAFPVAAEPPLANADPVPPPAFFPETSENRPGAAVFYEPEAEGVIPLRAVFDDGFALESLDRQFQLRMHALAQIDGKAFSPAEQEPARGGIYIPRFRLYFEGQLTDLVEYELSLQRSVEGLFDVLDANVNFVIDEAFQVRVGRAIVPYSFAWYDHLEQYYITPERGLFPLNFGLARQAGIFAHGKVLEERLQYAVGATFGQLAGLADTNTTRDGIAYFNLRPFLHGDSVLQFLNVGGSISVGEQTYESEMLPLRTSIQTSENDEAAQAASSIFLEFNDGVVAKGKRLQGALHTSLYSGPFSLEAEWYAARFGTAPDANADSIDLPVFGYDITLAAFLTGETVEDRETVAPIRPLTRDGTGRGAVEVFGRFSYLNVGEEVFTAGLVDPDDWTDRAAITDIGVNWYLSRFVRVSFDWQHAMFADPVLLNAERDLRSRTADLYWLRCQLYF